MKGLRCLLMVLTGFGAMGPASAQTAAASAAPPVFPTAPPPPYVTPETPQGSGPYPARMEADPRLPTHTVYRPVDLAKLGAEKLPIVAWGNGACVNQGNRFRYFLSEIASHGFLVVSIGPLSSREVETATSGSSSPSVPAAGSPAAIRAAALGASAPPPAIPGPAHTTAAQLTDAIDWAIAENTRDGSPYRGRVDTAQVAVMGQSCGGLQAIDIAIRDPRVKTLGVWNSGLFANAERAAEIAAAYVTKDDLKRLRASAIYVTGEPSDVAFNNAKDDVSRIEGTPVFYAWRERTGHGGTYREPGGSAFGRVAVAWLRWQLKDDPGAARMFTGADCGLCTQADWHVQKKRIN